ncbi:FliA/WhiG family RNA polymerase sigma factor [Neobacillus sp. 114]|uniref:sigma-70 family RNA polymerase sigma factor n=1 Tax=Neobacillus sp. 114 TaxID=3048535 RepID=UPI0024C3B44F|nr:FliA/WhiG family RNA polymerase sigma factor [Neobacillus sp. 114]
MNYCSEEILDQYIPLVHMVVGQMKKKLSDQVDEKDLFSSGLVGLWDASRKFDASHGAKFETYAVQRIRGAILDGLRQSDHASRTLRKKEKMFREALETLEQSILRKPTKQEVSEYIGMEVEEYEQALVQISYIHQDSLDRPVQEMDQESSIYHQIEDHYFGRQDDLIEAKERKKMLASLIDQLPEREKQILALIYFENLSFTDVSRIFDVHKSRISQIHARAIKKLRMAMDEQGFSI